MDPEWHFPGMAWDAVFTEAVSGRRSKGRSGWDSAVTAGKSRCALCDELNPAIDVIQGPPRVRSLKANFLLAWPSSSWLPCTSIRFKQQWREATGLDKKEMLQEGRRGRVIRGMGCDLDF